MVVVLLVGAKLEENSDFETFFQLCFPQLMDDSQLVQNHDKCSTRISYTSLPKSPRVFDLIRYV